LEEFREEKIAKEKFLIEQQRLEHDHKIREQIDADRKK